MALFCGHRDFRMIGRHPHAAATFDNVSHQLHAGQTARMPAQRDTVQAIIQHLLGIGRGKQGNAGRDKIEIRIARHRAGFGAMIIAHQQQGATLFIGAGKIGVAQRVHRTIHTRRLAIPDRKHPLDLGSGKQPHHLAAPSGSGGQVFVHAGLEIHVMRTQLFFRLPQLHIIAPDGRAAIARDIATRVQPLRIIAFALLNGQTHQRLHPRHVNPTVLGSQPVTQFERQPFILRCVQHDTLHVRPNS